MPVGGMYFSGPWHLPVYLHQNMYGYQWNAGNHSVSKETVLHFYFFSIHAIENAAIQWPYDGPLEVRYLTLAGKGQVERRSLKLERGSYNIRNRKDCCL